MRLRDIERQARVAFQSSQVQKEADWEHAHLPKAERPMRGDRFSTSEEESDAEEPPKKKKKNSKGKAKKGDDKKKDDE